MNKKKLLNLLWKLSFVFVILSAVFYVLPRSHPIWATIIFGISFVSWIGLATMLAFIDAKK